MKEGYQFRAYPTLKQIAILRFWIGCQRFIYNGKVGENRYFRAFAGKFLSNTGLVAPIDQQYHQFKSELTPWLDQVPSQVLRNGAYQWAQAYQRYPTAQMKELKLRIGTTKHPLGVLEFTAHRDFKIPDSIHLSVHGGRWSLSFSADSGRAEPDEAQTLAALKMLSAEELTALTLGLDRGVTVPLVGSDRKMWDILEAQQRKINQPERYKKRWQRRLARRVKGSGRRERAKRRVARVSLYAAEVRKDFAHQTSHRIVAGAASLFVFEDLKVRNMTASARGTVAEPGESVAQRAGLNRSILKSADNADINAAKVLAQRGVAAILSGAIVIKEKRRASIRKKVAVECSEPVEAISPTCVEIAVSRLGSQEPRAAV